MTVYVIVSYDIDDADSYAGYVQAVGPLLQKYSGEVLVADTNAKALEGPSRAANVVLRFASDEQAMGWYNDPDYAALRQTRLDTTSNGMMALAQEFVPPA
jgi:uncharacterized protein (DUF1330 family)